MKDKPTRISRSPPSPHILSRKPLPNGQCGRVRRYVGLGGQCIGADLQARARGHAVERVEELVARRKPNGRRARPAVVVVEHLMGAQCLDKLEIPGRAGGENVAA